MQIHFSEASKDELRQWARGKSPGQYRRTCPDCSPSRSKKRDECLSASITSEKVLANCRHCGASGRVNLEEKVIAFKPHSPVAPRETPLPAPPVSGKAVKDIRPSLDALSLLWLKGRAISEDTAKRYGVVGARAFFRDLKREGPAIAFPYHVNGGVAGHKVRSTEAKDHVCDKGLYSLFGIQLVDLAKESQIVVCEGEADCLAFAEAGIVNPVSVPNGASSFGTFQESDDPKAQYGFLWSAKDKLDAAKRIYIATDMDEPGDKLADELARRIGKHRCWRVAFPEGCKDGNDTLLKHGKEALAQAIKEAKPWPIDGLYEADQFFDSVMNLFQNGFDDRVLTGLTPVDDLYSIGKGLLTVVTGVPGNGKSTFVDQLMVNCARRYGYVSAICSFENPVDVHIGKLAQVLVQKHFFKTDLPGPMMTEEELQNVLPFIHKHFKFMHQDDGKKATIESIIERIKTAVFRWGVRCVVVDPYNYIHRPRTAESETQFIDDILTELRLVAKLYDLHIWFIAHPTKMQMDVEGDYQVPKGYSISGCHDPKTEVLTTQGWVPHPLITMDHEVMCYDPATGALGYHRPLHVHVYDHDGDMHHWTGASLDMMVTPDHRMVARRLKETAMRFVYSRDITNARWIVPSSGVFRAKDNAVPVFDLGYNENDLMWFIGFWIAEGCVQMNSLSVCQAEGKHAVPKSVMDRLGFVYTDAISNGRAHEKRMWVARLIRKWHIDLIDAVIAECGEGCTNKRLPSFVWSLSSEAKRALLEGYWYGDGATRNNSRQAYTTSRVLADDIMRLAVECGFFVTGRVDYSSRPNIRDRYAVTWRHQRERSIQADRNFSVVAYTGKVYCLTVPGGAYVTRRNLKVAIAGNSAAWFSKPDFGLTVHRQPNAPGMVKISCWKVRFDWLGRVGETEVVYDNCRHIYMADAFDDMSPMEPGKAPNSYREARGWLA